MGDQITALTVDDYYPADTRVFWDVEDFPVPKNRDLCSFHRRVKRALECEGYIGELSIYAYIGDNKTPEELGGFDMAKIEIVHETDEKRSRLNKMLLDMLAWAYENPTTDRANFIIVAKDIPEENTELSSVMKTLTERGYHVFLAVPDDLPLNEVPPTDTADLIWRWTKLFDGRYPIEDFETDS